MATERQSGTTIILTVVGLAVLFLGALAVFKFWRPKAEPAVPPTEWVNYEPSDKSFRCRLPANWKRSDGGNLQSQSGWVTCERSGAHLSVETSFAESLLGDIGRVTNTPPVVTIHRRGRDKMRAKFGDYSEEESNTPGGGMGSQLVSEFRAKQGFPPTPLRGYRLTIAGVDRGVTALAYCRERDFEVMGPSLKQFLDSITAGSGG